MKPGRMISSAPATVILTRLKCASATNNIIKGRIRQLTAVLLGTKTPADHHDEPLRTEYIGGRAGGQRRSPAAAQTRAGQDDGRGRQRNEDSEDPMLTRRTFLVAGGIGLP